MDIPLDDPEANRAAAKIQAGFRGHMTRKKLKPEDKAEGEEVSGRGCYKNIQGVVGTLGNLECQDSLKIIHQGMIVCMLIREQWCRVTDKDV